MKVQVKQYFLIYVTKAGRHFSKTVEISILKAISPEQSYLVAFLLNN